MLSGILVVSVLQFLFALAIRERHPIVTIEDGKIKGKLSKTHTGKEFYEFNDIPYAAPPVGNLRLAEPVPPYKWNGIKDGTKVTKQCMSKFPIDDVRRLNPDPRMNEDCLYLTVMTPQLLEVKNNQTDELLPVYIFIYGGVFTFGQSTAFDYRFFIDEDVIVVSFSFRSSTLGFLTTEDGVIPGNIGLKDQLMVLKWVNKNINKFGGDPKKVTLGGHSSGASSVSYHVLNKKAKGLFRAAIIQSGSALQPCSVSHNPRQTAFKLGEIMSKDFVASQNTSEDLLKLLRSLPADVLCDGEVELPEMSIYPLYKTLPLWAPSIENSYYENAIIIGPMHENYKNGITNHVPILIGATDEENKNAKNVSFYASVADANYLSVMQPTMNISKENIAPLIEEIKEIFIKQPTFSANLTGMVKFLSEAIFSMPIKMNAYLHSKYADVYLYEFSYLGPLNNLYTWQKSVNYKLKGIGKSGHVDELPFLFNFRSDKNAIPSNTDLLMRKRMLRLWSNFIKYMNPTPHDDPLLENIRWPKVRQDSYKYLQIDEKLNVRKNPPRFQEWKDRINKYFNSPRYSY